MRHMSESVRESKGAHESGEIHNEGERHVLRV
jgi:hypothetical protein